MNTTAPTSQCFLYHSVISEHEEARCVADIVKVARQFNGDNGITGLLVFDGMRFYQYLEGPQAPMLQLIERLRKDSRHTQFTPVWMAGLHEPRRFSGWAMGYAYADEGDPLGSLAALSGLQALERFQQLSGSLDLA